MCRLLLRLGFIDAAFAFFRVHFPAFATFSEADVHSILSYGQGQVFLLHIELNLRVRRYERIRGQLEAFLAAPYIHQYTIKRYSTKIGALHLASQFPSVEYQFGGAFAEFLEPLNMVISMCKRWALFERLYPKSPSSTSTAAAKVETTDPLWVRFATFNRLLETGRTSVHFNANSGQLMDAGFYFKLLTNLNAVTLNVVGLASTLLLGAELDRKTNYPAEARSKLAQAEDLFGQAADAAAFQRRYLSVEGVIACDADDAAAAADGNISNPFAHFEQQLSGSAQIVRDFIRRRLPSVGATAAAVADPLAVLVRQKFEALKSGDGGSDGGPPLHHLSLFYLAYQMVALEQMLSFQKNEVVQEGQQQPLVEDCHQLLLLLESYTTEGHVPALKKACQLVVAAKKEAVAEEAAKKSEQQLSAPRPEQLRSTMEQQLLHHGPCGRPFWSVATGYLRQMVEEGHQQGPPSGGPLLPQALAFLNKLCPISSFDYEGSAARCELFLLRSTVIYRLLKPALRERRKAEALFTVHSDAMLSSKSSSSTSTEEAPAAAAAVDYQQSSGTAKRGGGGGAQGTSKTPAAAPKTAKKSKKALFADQPAGELPATTGKESLESRRRIIISSEETQQQQQCSAVAVTPQCAKKGGGGFFNGKRTMTTGVLRQRNRPVTGKKDIPLINLDDDDDDDVILVEEKLGQLKLSSLDTTTAAAAAKKKQNFLLAVDLNGAETASIRRAYEHADVEKALKEARETAKKVSTYVGLHPSWRLYQELQFLLFQLARAGAELGATEEGDQQLQQQLQTMGYHLGEAGDHIAYRYRAISIASRKAKCMSSSGKSFSAAAAAPVFTFTAENRLLQFKLNDYSSANYTPYAARLPKCWRFLQLKSFMAEFEEVMAGNSSSMMMTERVAYWKRRYEIDAHLSTLLRSFEDAYIGPFKGLLLGESASASYRKACAAFREALEKAAKKAGLAVVEGHHHHQAAMLEVFTESVLFVESEAQLVAGVRMLFGGREGQEIAMMALEAKVIELKRTHFKRWMVSDSVCNGAPLPSSSSSSSAAEAAQTRRLEELVRTFAPLGVILDGAMAQFPLECLPTTRRVHQAMFRVPSLRVACLLYRARLGKVSEHSCYYLVNPADNLANTDKYFRAKFQAFVQLEPGWEGVIGAEPDLTQMAACLQAKDLFVYFGHGSGSIYYRRMAGGGLDSLPQLRSASLVIGCSSGRVTAESALEGVYGTAYRFLANGAPCYVGALWDITDKDIDLYADQLLAYAVKQWAAPTTCGTVGAPPPKKEKEGAIARALSKSREICKLKYLTGAAPVFYGLPMSTGGHFFFFFWSCFSDDRVPGSSLLFEHSFAAFILLVIIIHQQQPKLVLGIETSCDDTGIALLRASDGAILAEVTASQTALHVSNGGIIPPVARDLHRSAIDRCVGECLKTAGGGVSARDLAAVAVTLRPGLSLSLLVGCQYAKKLSAKYHLPVVPIHHMEAHALTAMLQYAINFAFPFSVCSFQVCCGGHCLIVHVKGLHDFELLGRSIDDAPGDILDKTARALR
ncbi:Separin [Tyrophagus putrescentiae]|nr:Separin [Tyrophagus putrescentiae]